MGHIMHLSTCSVYKHAVLLLLCVLTTNITENACLFFLHCANGPSAYELQSTAGTMPGGTKKTPPSFLSTLLLTINKQVSNRSRQTFDFLVHITWKGKAVVRAEKNPSVKRSHLHWHKV